MWFPRDTRLPGEMGYASRLTSSNSQCLYYGSLAHESKKSYLVGANPGAPVLWISIDRAIARELEKRRGFCQRVS